MAASVTIWVFADVCEGVLIEGAMMGARGATNSGTGWAAGSCGGGGGGWTGAGAGVGSGWRTVAGPAPGLVSGFFLNTDTINFLLHAGQVLSHASGS
jgi:hypothetical protein